MTFARHSLVRLGKRLQFAEKVVVPRRNLVPKPASLSFEEAACLPTAWLTAYRMLFTQGRLTPGETVLVQGAGGGDGFGGHRWRMKKSGAVCSF